MSTAVIVTVPVLEVASAAMVRVTSLLRLKSVDAALVPAAASTVSVIISLDTPPLRVAVTVDELLVPLSSMDDGVSTRFTVGGASSSSIVNV